MMYKLDSDKQIQVANDTLGKILSAYGISDFTSTPIEEGIANTSFVIKTANGAYVLRIYAEGRRNDDEIRLEIRFQDFLRENSIPIPLIHKNAAGEEVTVTDISGTHWRSVLMDFVEGQSVTLQPSKELLAELARLQAKMHLLGMEFTQTVQEKKEPWRDLRDSLAVKVTTIPEGRDDVRALIERVKAYRQPLNPALPHGYNHLDLDFDGNVLTKDGHVAGVVDFEDVQYSPAIACLGFTMWNILDDQGEEEMRFYLAEYEKIRPLSSLEKEELPHIIFFRNYAIAMIRLLLWDKDTPIEDITDILELEQQIPTLRFQLAP